MKKTRFIALALVVAIALMGAGYAAWTDRLVVDTKIDTGWLDVDFIKVEKPKGTWKNPYTDPEHVTVTGDIVKALPGDDADNDGSKDYVEMEIGNLYPGAKVKRVVTLQNLSSIPVRIDKNDIKFDFVSGDHNVKKAMNINVEFDIKGNNQGHSVEEADVELQHRPDPKPKNVTLQSNATMDILIEFELDYYRAGNEVTEDKDNIVYRMTLDFEQFNAGNFN